MIGVDMCGMGVLLTSIILMICSKFTLLNQ